MGGSGGEDGGGGGGGGSGRSVFVTGAARRTTACFPSPNACGHLFEQVSRRLPGGASHSQGETAQTGRLVRASPAVVLPSTSRSEGRCCTESHAPVQPHDAALRAGRDKLAALRRANRDLKTKLRLLVSPTSGCSCLLPCGYPACGGRCFGDQHVCLR